MKKTLGLLIFSALIASTSNAQFWKLRRLEYSAGLGTTQIFGDIGGFSKGKNILGLKDFTFRHTRFNTNMNIRYRLMDDISARINLTYGGYHTTDTRGSNESRGLESSTRFFEHDLIGEFYFLKNRAENSFLAQKGRKMPLNTIFSMLDCYTFTGIGIISYKVNPNELLSTSIEENKGKAAVIPIGVGVNLNFSPDFNIGAELGARYTFTDNLDGYTSPYSESNDLYYLFNLSIIYKIKTGTRGRAF